MPKAKQDVNLCKEMKLEENKVWICLLHCRCAQLDPGASEPCSMQQQSQPCIRLVQHSFSDFFFPESLDLVSLVDNGKA